ncbi:hypothetical protein R1flu_026272 [Riccia fluitans]|uniref:Retrotransposon gag domain-containing protein n=1 Tax=Riccia fluitans TaxID=41844 RepID=A0ABD1XFH2_9MARC
MCIDQEDKDVIQTLINTMQNQPETKNEHHGHYHRLVAQMNMKYMRLKETLRIIPIPCRDPRHQIACKWYNHKKTALTDWDDLKTTFFKRFWTLDYKHTDLKKLASLRRKKESLQDYEERFKELLDQIPARAQGQAPYSKEQAVIWFLEGLPEPVEMFCRQQGAGTLDDAIKAAKTYEILGTLSPKRV